MPAERKPIHMLEFPPDAYELIKPGDHTAVKPSLKMHFPKHKEQSRSRPPRPSNFGSNLIDCVVSATDYAISDYKHTVGDHAFKYSNANYVRGFASDYLRLISQALTDPENANFLLKEMRNDQFQAELSEFDGLKKRIKKKPTALNLETLIGTTDPTGKTNNLPTVEADERPQVRFALTEVNHIDVEKIHTSLVELEAAKTVSGVTPEKSIELKQQAEVLQSTIDNIWVTKLSLSFNATYFNTDQKKVDVISLTNFNILAYPDGRISMEFWLITQGGNKLLLKVLPHEHDIDHDKLQKYLDTLYLCLTEDNHRKKKK